MLRDVHCQAVARFDVRGVMRVFQTEPDQSIVEDFQWSAVVVDVFPSMFCIRSFRACMIHYGRG